MSNSGEERPFAESKRIPLWERMLTVSAILLLSNAVIPLIRLENGYLDDPTNGDPVTQIIFIIVYVVIFFIFIKSFNRKTLGKLMHLWPLGFLIIFSLFSVSWAFMPDVSFRRCMALLGTSGFGIYISNRYSWSEFLEVLLWSLGIMAVLSAITALFFPEYGIESIDVTGWRGVFSHKNILGRFMALSSVMWLESWWNHKKKMAGLFFSLSVMLLILSQSVTSLLIFIVLSVFLLSWNIMKKIKHSYLTLAIFLILAAIATVGLVVIIENMDILWSLLDRDASFTGRTDIWSAVWDMIKLHPWVGYGYGSFWLGSDGPSGYVWQYAQWKVPHAHNGFLDILVQIGGIGLCLLILSLILNIYKILVLLQKDNTSEFFVLVILFLYIILCNFSESNFMVPNNLHWVMYIIISFELSIKFAHKSISSSRKIIN